MTYSISQQFDGKQTKNEKWEEYHDRNQCFRSFPNNLWKKYENLTARKIKQRKLFMVFCLRLWFEIWKGIRYHGSNVSMVNLNNSWSSLANFEYSSIYAKTNWAFDRQLNFYENETKPNQDWFCLIFCNFLIHGQYLKNDNILDF